MIGNKEVAMMIDTACTMAVYAMRKVCSDEELEEYFTVNRDRLSGQGFSYDEIDAFQNSLHQAMLDLR